MSKRQRFFVELIQDQVTVISWTKLVADAERITTSETAAPVNTFPAKTVPGSQLGLHQATIPDNSNTTASNPLKSRGKVKLAVPNSTQTKPAEMSRQRLEDGNMMNSTSRAPKSNVKRMMEAKVEFDDDAMAMKLAVPKGKVQRSMPIPGAKTSCRTKKKTKACFCCSKKDPGASTRT